LSLGEFLLLQKLIATLVAEILPNGELTRRSRLVQRKLFIDGRMALGRVAFFLAELMMESGLSAIAAKY
jgi:hypothetical protein